MKIRVWLGGGRTEAAGRGDVVVAIGVGEGEGEGERTGEAADVGDGAEVGDPGGCCMTACSRATWGQLTVQSIALGGGFG